MDTRGGEDFRLLLTFTAGLGQLESPRCVLEVVVLFSCRSSIAIFLVGWVMFALLITKIDTLTTARQINPKT